ncbi:proteoglycan 4-like isoform X1 [Nilaparvata lugens]|uniref:proteoglycan 4-like isoform X1 n=1 Tax=Nilaparvata lugens TaxID=108931 RepID=UPI00193DC18E|nr:proteoglycan 4-like isoform X1 [Nilaparvata lugens]
MDPKRDGASLKKFNFAPLLKEVLDKTMNESTIKNGFRVCGLYPFNVNSVDFTKCNIMSTGTKETELKGSGQKHHAEKEVILKHIESFIDPNTLQQFKETYKLFTPIWNGSESSHDLYVVWKKIKDETRVETYQTEDLQIDNDLQDDNLGIDILPIEDLGLGPFNDLTDDDPVIDNQPSCSTSIHPPKPTPTKPSCSTSIHPSKPTPTKPSCSTSIHQSKPTPTKPSCSTSIHPSKPTPTKPSCSTSIHQSKPTPRPKSPLRREKLAKVLSPETEGNNVPFPLKDILLWPGTPTKSNLKRTKTRMPSVVTSLKWLDYEDKKRKKKKENEKLKDERKRMREERKDTQKKETRKRKPKLKISKTTGYAKFATDDTPPN